MRAGRALIGGGPAKVRPPAAVRPRVAAGVAPFAGGCVGRGAAPGHRRWFRPALLSPGRSIPLLLRRRGPCRGGVFGRGRAPGHRRTLGATPSPPPVRGRCVATSTAPAPFFHPPGPLILLAGDGGVRADGPGHVRRPGRRRAGGRPLVTQRGLRAAGPVDSRRHAARAGGLRLLVLRDGTQRGLAGCGSGGRPSSRRAGRGDRPSTLRLAASRGFLGIILFSRSTFGRFPCELTPRKRNDSEFFDDGLFAQDGRSPRPMKMGASHRPLLAQGSRAGRTKALGYLV